MKKAAAAFCGVLWCVMLFCVPASAAIPWTPTDRFFVNDFADVISAEDEERIYQAGVQLFEKTKAQVVAVTVPSLEGMDIRDFGVQLGREWGVGEKEKDTGVVLILALEERQVRIEVGYGLEGILTDAKTGVILDEYARPPFSSKRLFRRHGKSLQRSGKRGLYRVRPLARIRLHAASG